MSDNFTFGNVSGGNNQIGGSGNTFNEGPGARPPFVPSAAPGASGGAPGHALYAFADIVGYSKLAVRLHKPSQDYLAGVLADGLAEAGVSPGLVNWQHQGDATMMAFPADTDAGKVLARMPEYVNDELVDRNQFMAPVARTRVRMAFTMGVSVPAALGLAGGSPIAVARLVNWEPFRLAMAEAANVHRGVVIDDHLHAQYVGQHFRADINPDDYVGIHIRDERKGFDARAWVKLFGCPGERVRELFPDA